MGNSQSMLGRMPPWVIAIAIIAVVVLASLLFFSNRPFNCSKNSEGFSCGFVQEPNVTYEKYYGYFYDWDQNGKTYCSYEVVDLGFADDEISVRAVSTGQVKDRDGNSVDNTWVFRGYKHGNSLAMAYVTAKKPRSGNGVYYLIQNQGDYAGFWIGVDWPSGKTIRCPYMLTKTEKRGSESCEGRWPYLFSAANACQLIEFQ